MTEWIKFRNKKDWISWKKKDGSKFIQLLTFGKRFKWDLKIAHENNRQIITRIGIDKKDAMVIIKKFIAPKKR